MRLGQGFNSYTQQVCLDKAVLPAPATTTNPKGIITISGGTPTTGRDDNDPISDEEKTNGGDRDSLAKPIQVMPWVKPQIVTYSLHFVDKLSDVTDAMNIQGMIRVGQRHKI
ncbi:hypothetical protein OQA88_2147 [Cercophora sp. LCS_1]